MKINQKTLNILDQCEIRDNAVFLPNVKLDRNEYLDVNKCLEAIGGKWNKKAKAHLFEGNPAEILDDLMISGEFTDFKKEFQYFPTPQSMARIMVEMADIQLGDVVLEPSAGQGAIADELPRDQVIVIELNPANAKVLQSKGYEVIVGDFLSFASDAVNKIVMNPPFTKQQDVDHILHAYEVLSPGGTLVSVVSESPFFRDNKKSILFRQFLDDADAEVIDNSEGAFKESGTMVKTRIIKIIKSA